ncbi:MAG: hypothetical protein PVH84_04890 [Candidatus Aminicenantes bacterium]|jgi:hypothetical protein
MADKLGTIKLLLGVGIVLMLVWFIVFSLAPASILTSLAFTETQGFFLRMFGIFPLSWALLYLLASKDPVKNLAIINGGIISGAFMIIGVLVYYFTMNFPLGWFNWVSVSVLFIFTLLLFMFKPKSP